MFSLSTKEHFHVVVVQWRQRNVRGVLHVQSCFKLMAFLRPQREFPNTVLEKKVNIHKHWTQVTRFKPLWVSVVIHCVCDTYFTRMIKIGNKTTTINNSFSMACLLFLARTLAKFSSSVLVVGASPFSPNAQFWISFASPALDSDLAWLLFQRS